MISQCPVSTKRHANRSLQARTASEKVLCPKKQKLAQGSMSDEYTKSFCVKLSWKCGTCITPNTPRIREHCVWAERRIFRREDYGGPWQNSVFCTWQGQGPQGVMPPGLPAQELHNQGSQHSNREEAGTHTLPLLSVQLLTAGGYQERQCKLI